MFAHKGYLTSLLLLAGCAHVEPARGPVTLRVIAINDFHGNLEPPSRGVEVDGAMVAAGGAGHLAAHVAALRAQAEHALVVSAGDLVGASPLLSGLFHDEPTIEAMNQLGLDINGVGNHEFDEGVEELHRLVKGGCHPQDGCQGPHPYEGAGFQFLAANVVDTHSEQTVFPSHTVREIAGIRVAVIGLTLEGTKAMLPPIVPQLRFDDEAETINRLVAQLKKDGVRAFVVLLHEGGFPGSKDPNACQGLSGPVTEILPRLDPEVDLVVSGHTHQAYICERDGLLLTSGGSYGRIVTDIELTLDPSSGDITAARAHNVVVDHGLEPVAEVEALVAAYREVSAPMANRVVTQLRAPLGTERTEGGVSELGRVIADAQLEATRAVGARVALMNAGGVRAPLAPTMGAEGWGDVTYAMLFASQPFGNVLMTLDLTGAQLLEALESQFGGDRMHPMDGSSNLSYAWRMQGRPHVVEDSVRLDGAPIDPEAMYAVTVNAYMASKPPFSEGRNPRRGVVDLDALVTYLGRAARFEAPSTEGVSRRDP